MDQRPSATSETGTPRAQLRILIVDDEEMLARSCESILTAEGYAVHRELRGRSALDYVRRNHPDFVLLDLMLPDLDGVSVLREIKLIAPDTLVAMMTGFATVSGSIEAVDSGAWEYIPKPFTATQLRVLAGRAAAQVLPRSGVLPAPLHPPGLGGIAGGDDVRVLTGKGAAMADELRDAVAAVLAGALQVLDDPALPDHLRPAMEDVAARARRAEQLAGKAGRADPA